MLLKRKIPKAYQKIIIEALLLEVSATELTEKYPVLDTPEYQKFLKKITSNNHLDLLDRMLGEYHVRNRLPILLTMQEFIQDDYYVHYGEIIFCVLMHQKYTGSKIPVEYRDTKKLRFVDGSGKRVQLPDGSYEFRTRLGLLQLIDSLHFKFMSKNKKLYADLTAEDKRLGELHASSQAASQPAKVGGTMRERVATDLYIVGQVEDWDILKPESSVGSKMIGIENWCTVYSNAWNVYRNAGTILYYVAKRSEDTTYIAGTSHSDSECRLKPVSDNYMSIGVEEDGTVIYPGRSGGETIFADQTGITNSTLQAKGIDLTTFQKIVDAIQNDFKSSKPPPLPESHYDEIYQFDDDGYAIDEYGDLIYDEEGEPITQDDLMTPEARAEEQRQEAERRQANKLKRAIGGNVTVFREQMRSYGDPNQRLMFVLDTMYNNTRLTPPVLDYITSVVVDEKDSKVKKSIPMQEANKELFKLFFIIFVNNNMSRGIHTSLSKERIEYLKEYFLSSPMTQESIDKGDYSLAFIANIQPIMDKFKEALPEGLQDSTFLIHAQSAIDDTVLRQYNTTTGAPHPFEYSPFFAREAEENNIIVTPDKILIDIEDKFDPDDLLNVDKTAMFIAMVSSLDKNKLSQLFENKFLSSKYDNILNETAEMIVNDSKYLQVINNRYTTVKTEISKNIFPADEEPGTIGPDRVTITWYTPDDVIASAAKTAEKRFSFDAATSFNRRESVLAILISHISQCPKVFKKLNEIVVSKREEKISADTFVEGAEFALSKPLEYVSNYTSRMTTIEFPQELEQLSKKAVLLENYLKSDEGKKGTSAAKDIFRRYGGYGAPPIAEQIDRAYGQKIIDYIGCIEQICSKINDLYSKDTPAGQAFMRIDYDAQKYFRNSLDGYFGGSVTPVKYLLNKFRKRIDLTWLMEILILIGESYARYGRLMGNVSNEHKNYWQMDGVFQNNLSKVNTEGGIGFLNVRKRMGMSDLKNIKVAHGVDYKETVHMFYRNAIRYSRRN